jgi:hypothetical protein
MNIAVRFPLLAGCEDLSDLDRRIAIRIIQRPTRTADRE